MQRTTAIPARPSTPGSPGPEGEAVSRIRVMIADDEETVRDVLLSLLNTDEEISVVGAGQDADEAIAIALTERPDVALLDVRMPGGGGARAAREITRLRPGTEVIALSADDDPKDVSTMLRAGAGAYLVKGDGTEGIVDMIHRCVQGSDGRIRVATVPSAPVVRPSGNRERRRRIEAFVRGEGVDIVYQPIFDLRSGRPVGAEALARFAVAALGGPDVWFAEAAEMGLGVELEIAAIRLAVGALDTLDPDLALDVNASPETCCTPELRELIESSDAERIVLEITEHTPVDDYGRLLTALAPLRERGVRLAIDDTCSGYASLRHVLHLRPDVVKLDVTLTRGIERDAARRSLVEAIVGFAPNVGAEVLAEGIETAEQLRALTRSGVALGQGYYLGRPAPLPPSGTWTRGRRGAVDQPIRQGAGA
jgi:EAL domain-containing protein (putative c-di-GMP-specific phosphodiesterase class I)/DNA-binding NarL/FixJ family response regulator